jgi:D-cysteine desulfhydrase
MKEFAYPPRIDIARLPTPIVPLRRFGGRLGVELYMKRDDLTGVALSGNKVRKLEFVLADALKKKADAVLTCGGAQSNHARATAIAAAMFGLRCRLLLRTPDPGNPPAAEGNILLDRMAGAEIVWITPEEYRNRDAIFEREAALLKKEGRRPYIIPEGASEARGAWGYIRAAEEIADEIASLGPGPATIVHATGSGGTAAGLALGARLFDIPARIVTFNVCEDRLHFIHVIGNICQEAISEFQLPIDFDPPRDLEIIDGYAGSGYALSRPEELDLICEVARTEGIFLDPVYTGKAFFGMVQELQKKPGCFGKRIIFLHTGGIFGLFSKAAEINSIL